MDISYFSPDRFFDLTDFEHKDLFSNTEHVWDILPKLHSYIAQFQNTHKPNYNDGKHVYVGEGTIIEEGALIKGPAIIGKNCFIGHGAYLRENCILGDNVHIGHAVEVKKSLFLNNSYASHFNYVGDSIIGKKANLAAGAILANHRLDKRQVMVQTETLKIETKLEKFGSIIGDASVVGVNSVLNPGTILEKNCIVYPLTSVKGVHPKGSLIQ